MREASWYLIRTDKLPERQHIADSVEDVEVRMARALIRVS
jgi:hypothetical protein